MELAEADVADKDGIENEIAVLESNLLEQQEFSALYAMQAESFSPTESSTLDPLATNETETSEEVITNNEETVKNYEESIASSEEVKSNEEDNNSIEELESNTEESIANNEEAISSSEVYKGTDYKDNYKTKKINIGEKSPGSTISVNELDEMNNTDMNRPKKSRRKPKSERNTVLLNL